MSVSVDVRVNVNVNSIRVWQVLSDFNNITEEQARTICEDFMIADVDLPPDGFAHDYMETIQDVCESMESPDIREAMLSNSTDLQLSNDTEDPFYCSTKILANKLDRYLIYSKNIYRCDICCTDNLIDGVQLSCGQKSKPCQGMFCKECVSQWLTTCVARCPTCRDFCKEIRKLPINVSPKTNTNTNTKTKTKKIVVTVRNKCHN